MVGRVAAEGGAGRVGYFCIQVSSSYLPFQMVEARVQVSRGIHNINVILGINLWIYFGISCFSTRCNVILLYIFVYSL